ncbi:hypothetical protein FQN57_002520 [Myotisia sp. PD_48]|nr:hypothetical protein FQN57_002520 [Myotisia sp. PD_48]
MEPLSPADDGYLGQQLPEEFNLDYGEEPTVLDMARNVTVDGTSLVSRTPEEAFRLTLFDVTCLLINRTIGTGIFNGPQEVMKGVRSPGIAILLWVCGCIYGLCGAHVFLEYGLNVPRYVIEGEEQSVPRSGGELHYLQYVFSWPNYRRGTVLLSGVLFGISFILVGNMAGNCIDCALHLMQIAQPNKAPDDFSRGAIRGIAILIAGVTCFIHAFSRRGGILLNNAFAIIKALILVFIIIATWVVAGRASGIHGSQKSSGTDPPANLPADNKAFGASQAYLSVVFAFFGFDQPSYVLGEIKHPRKNLQRSMWWGMGIVSVLYIGVNICYMVVVPTEVQLRNNVAQEFFNIIFKSGYHGKQTFHAFLAISSFGNVVVWTFTAARMKQEIAKQYFIPFAKFFAQDTDFSLGRLLRWLDRPSLKFCTRGIRLLNPANHSEKTPAGALLLHFLSCLVLIFATWGMRVSDAYSVLFRIFTYVIAAWFGFFLALGILILHFWSPPQLPPPEPAQTQNHNNDRDQQPKEKTWEQMIDGTVNAKAGVVCAGLYLLGSLFPIIMNWIPPSGTSEITWYVVPLTSWCVLAVSAIWFIGFRAIVGYRGHKGHKEFVVLSNLEFEREEHHGAAGEITSGTKRGGFILRKEEISASWQPKEMRVPNRFNVSNGGSAVENHAL